MKAIVLAGTVAWISSGSRTSPIRRPARVRRCAAAGPVNRLDCWVRSNEGHAYQARLPLIPGYDVAGESCASATASRPLCPAPADS